MSKSDALDLYAKVEDLLGVKEASPALYSHYTLFLNTIHFDSILDVGCGSGDFLLQVNHSFEPKEILGIDLSPSMVKRSREQGVTAQCMNLCDLDGSFDVITAVFDMLNYLNDKELEHFLHCVVSRINQGGYFLCDINTLYGFEEVAVGLYIVDDGDRFLAIESDFEEGIYRSDFTLFEKSESLYQKSKETISQYCHTVEKIKTYLSGMELVVRDDVFLYGDDADKSFLVFRKVPLGS